MVLSAVSVGTSATSWIELIMILVLFPVSFLVLFKHVVEDLFELMLETQESKIVWQNYNRDVNNCYVKEQVIGRKTKRWGYSFTCPILCLDRCPKLACMLSTYVLRRILKKILTRWEFEYFGPKLFRNIVDRFSVPK